MECNDSSAVCASPTGPTGSTHENVCSLNGKKVMAVRPHLRSTSSSTLPLVSQEQANSGCSASSDSCSDIITVAPNPRRKQAITIDLREIKSISSSVKDASSRYWGPICYIKHTNLDSRPLTFIERLRLAKVHYFTIPNVIRLFLVLFFLWWFIFNTGKLWNDFREHDTNIYLEYEMPIKSLPPGITFCSHCLLCAFPNDSVIHAEDIMTNELVQNMLNVNGSDDQLKDIQISCHIYSTTWVNSNKQQVYNCTDIAPVVISMQEGHKCFTFFSDIYGNISRMTRKDPERGQLLFEAVPVIRFILEGKFLSGNLVFRHARISNSFHKSSWGDMNLNRTGIAYTGMYMTLHDPAILPDMYSFQYYRLQRNKVSVVPFVKRVQRLRPWPYAMYCVKYRDDRASQRPDELDQNTLQAAPNASTRLELYRSRGECFLYCMWRTLNANRCANIFSIITLEMVQQEQFYRFAQFLQEMAKLKIQRELQKRNGNSESEDNESIDSRINFDDAKYLVKFCPRSYSSYKAYLKTRRHCLKVCPKACDVETYAEQNVFDFKSDGKTNASIVEVVWARKPITYVYHRSKMDRVEFIGSIGGHAHIWLGLSIPYFISYVIKLIKWGEFLPAHTCCCVATWWRSCFVRRRK